MVGGGSSSAPTRYKDGRQWRLGTDADVAWIQQSTAPGLAITSAIPPVFAAYATVVVPDKNEGRAAHTRLVLRLLGEQSGGRGARLPGHRRRRRGVSRRAPGDPVLGLGVRARAGGPAEAARWRYGPESWRAPGPDLIFPADHTWLLSRLWDDDWRCLGGPAALVDRFLDQPQLQVRRVALGEDATPPGHVAR